jgi:hypothetical protein
VSGTRVQKVCNSLSTNLEFQKYGEYNNIPTYSYKAVEERRQKVTTEAAVIHLILSSKKNFVTQEMR